MVKVRQSKAKQESNPEVICVDSYKPNKISSKAVQSKKEQPWIDSGIVKLSTADKAVIKSRLACLLTKSSMLHRTPCTNSLGYLGSSQLSVGKVVASMWSPKNSFKFFTMASIIG